MKINTRQIAHTALFVAVIGVMTMVPQLGLLQTPIVAINIILIPSLVASQVLDLKSSMLVSTFMGIFSLINSYMRATTLLAFAVQNPLVSVLPRIFVGIVACLVYNFCKRLARNSTSKFFSKTLPSAVGAFAGVVTNTTLFLGMILLLYGGKMLSTGVAVGMPFILGIVVANTIPEIILSILAVPVCTYAIDKIKRAV